MQQVDQLALGERPEIVLPLRQRLWPPRLGKVTKPERNQLTSREPLGGVPRPHVGVRQSRARVVDRELPHTYYYVPHSSAGARLEGDTPYRSLSEQSPDAGERDT